MITCSTARNGASSSTYITASAKNAATSESTLTTGLRWRMTTIEKMTATAAKVKKTMNSIIGVAGSRGREVSGQPTARLRDHETSKPFSNPSTNNEKRHQNNIAHRQRQKHLPPQLHQQVVL